MKDSKRKLKMYDISFVGLKQGKHIFDYQIDNSFFESFNYNEFNEVSQKVTVILDKKSNLMELTFTSEGIVNVNCDISNEPFDLPTQGELFLVVKFGEEFNDENDELLILPNGEHTINIAQYIYEMIILSVPVKHIHPNIEDESFAGVLHTLEELSPKEKDIVEDYQDIDPRWNELRKLLNK